MKSILVAVEQHEHLSSLLETAYLFAVQHGSYVEGISPRPILTGFVGDASFVAMNELEDPRATEDEARKDFEDFMRGRGVAGESAGTPTGLSFGWAPKSDKAIPSLSEAARVFDITVIGRPAFGSTSPLMSTVEPVLFESGRPILVAPPGPPKTIGRTVVVAWNGSTEGARATAFAMPILRAADRVIILTVQGGMVAGPDGETAARHLRRHGLKVETAFAESADRSVGETIMAQATALGCDLLIKGAYTQSRLRQMFFGGQTKYLLTSATVPLFMSH